MKSVAYIGRSNNIHDKRFVKTLNKKFNVLEIYTKDLVSRSISVDKFVNISLIVAGPLTDAVSVIPISVKVPILGISHAFDLNTEFDNQDIKGNIARCAAIMTDCKHITNILRENYDFTKEIYETPWGCDSDYFSKIKVPFEKKLKILVTRNWFSIYRNDVIIDALKILELKKIEFTCTFIGHGPLLEDQINKLGKPSESSYIRFLGQKNKAEIRNAMSDNWIYISAASSDGTSVSLLEAMAAGMICITTDFPSNLEWIEDSKSGFTFSNGNSEALASLIELISSLSLDEKIKISRTAKSTIPTRGDWRHSQKVFIAATMAMT